VVEIKLLSRDSSLIWYQSLDNQTITSSNLTISIYLIKIKHKVKWTHASFKLKELSLEGGVIEYYKSYPEISPNGLNF
jgi:hypothetical protein